MNKKKLQNSQKKKKKKKKRKKKKGYYYARIGINKPLLLVVDLLSITLVQSLKKKKMHHLSLQRNLPFFL
jgi:hypothetical protein